jgi:hypothetical protein
VFHRGAAAIGYAETLGAEPVTMTECEVHRQRIEESLGVRPALVAHVRGKNVMLKGQRFLQNDCGGRCARTGVLFWPKAQNRRRIGACSETVNEGKYQESEL